VRLEPGLLTIGQLVALHATSLQSGVRSRA
jgi:hypothetical protein